MGSASWNPPTAVGHHLRWRTASQWWMSVFTISPDSTSHTRTVLSDEPEMITYNKEYAAINMTFEVSSKRKSGISDLEVDPDPSDN